MHPSGRLTLLLTLALLAGCAVTIQDTHFFNPGPPERPTPIAAAGVRAETLTIRRENGVALHAVYVTRPDATAEILYFGGNVSRVDDYADGVVRATAPLRVNVLMVDYRGYGGSTGTPAIAAVKDDALAAFDLLRERAGARPIVVHGFSLGSFIAAHVAVNRPVAALVLESTAPDVTTWARNSVPTLLKPFLRIRIAEALKQESNTERLRRYSGPLLLVTGTNDDVTPPKFAASLFATSASAAKRQAIIEGATHGDAMTFPAAIEAYTRFLREAL